MLDYQSYQFQLCQLDLQKMFEGRASPTFLTFCPQQIKQEPEDIQKYEDEMIGFVTSPEFDQEPTNGHSEDLSVQVGDSSCEMKKKLEYLQKEREDLVKKNRTYQVMAEQNQVLVKRLQKERQDLAEEVSKAFERSQTLVTSLQKEKDWSWIEVEGWQTLVTSLRAKGDFPGRS